MAETFAGRRLTTAYRQGQDRIAADLIAALRSVWPLLVVDQLDDTFERWLTAVIPIVNARHATATSLAAAYVQAFKQAESAGDVSPILAPPPSVDALTTSMLVTGPISIKKAVGRGVPLARAASVAEAASSASAMRHALDGGRNTVRSTLAADPDSGGWRRVTSGAACDFCQMLAGRGAVYSARSADFHSHDGCGCSAEPVYR